MAITFDTNLMPTSGKTLGDASNQWGINGYTLGDACAKGVDTSISDGSTSTALPTTQAVATYVGSKAHLPAVTSSDNGKILKVADGAWTSYTLVKSDITSLGIAPTNGPSFTMSISMGRASGTQFGVNSVATGINLKAEEKASHAEGENTCAWAWASHSEGYATIASGPCSHVFGKYNVADSYNTDWPEWVSGTSYSVNDKVKRTVYSDYDFRYHVTPYICTTANSDVEFDSSNWQDQSERLGGLMNFVEIVGNGTADNARSNARVLDWNGDERLKGDLYVGCNADSTGGSKVAKLSDISNLVSSITMNGSSITPTSGVIDLGTVITSHQDISGLAPKSHATNATTYGGATGTNYGHVRLSDTYTTVGSSGKAANSIGASAWAVQSVYNDLTGSTTITGDNIGTLNASTKLDVGSRIMYKIGKLVILSMNFTIKDNQSITTSTKLFTVASGYRPASDIQAIAGVYDRNGNVGAKTIIARMTSGGAIYETLSDSWSSGSLGFTFIYYVA